MPQARPWCCPEPRCLPLFAFNLYSTPKPGESFICFGKMPETEHLKLSEPPPAEPDYLDGPRNVDVWWELLMAGLAIAGVLGVGILLGLYMGLTS